MPAFLARARQVGERIRGHLESIQAECPLVGDVRGIGPMLAMEFVQNRESKVPVPVEFVGRITAETLKRGLITIRAGLYSNCLRFLPPLTLSDAEIEALFQDQFLGGPHLRKGFFCDENTTIGFTADIPERYLLLAKGRERPIYGSQEKARNCYQQNRQIL